MLDREGYILTNDHVVDGAQHRARALRDGRAGRRARVIGVDPSTDLALLKIDAGDRTLTPLALGSSQDLKVGQPAIAIGSPFRLEGTLTTGVISALGRSINAPNDFSIDNVVQTDAAINPGNSGGPLLDANGRVVGINAQIATSTQSNSGVGFAIPIDTAKQVLAAAQARRGDQARLPRRRDRRRRDRRGRGRRRRRARRAGRRRGPARRRPRRCRSAAATVARVRRRRGGRRRAKPGRDVEIGVRRGERRAHADRHARHAAGAGATG